MKESDRIWARRSSIKPAVHTYADRMRGNPTDAERKMWQQLRHLFREAHFRRQVGIGGSIADFVSHRHKLVIEIDGGQHSV
jgi:very-short-patch-repair endonuclease